MRNKLSNSLWGLLFIIIGVGFAGNVIFGWKFEIFFDGWWTLFIIIPCFISMVNHGIGFGSTFGFLVGVLLLASNYVTFPFDAWRLVVPVILMLIGFRIIFQGVFQRKPNYYNQKVEFTETQNETSSSNTSREYNAIFAGNRIQIDDTFDGASLSAVFGGLAIDLRDAKINHDVQIHAQAIFGGIDIYIPQGVKVKINNVPVFGGVSNKAPSNNDPGAPTIFINSTCMFGGIDIK